MWGRVHPSKIGLGPRMIMRSIRSDPLRRLGLTNDLLLQMLTNGNTVGPEYAEIMDSWLTEMKRELSPDETEEIATLGPLSTLSIYDVEFRDLYLKLKDAVKKILQNRKEEHLSPASGLR